MNKFSKKDLLFCVITGLTTGVIGWRVFEYLGTKNFLGIIPPLWLIVVVPILWIIGINFGYFLGRWMNFFNQFGKFAAVGFTNFAVDSGVLYILIGFSGIKAGIWYTVFKSISFLFGISHSYLWNRLWVFESKSTGVGQEFSKFFTVGVVSIFINVGIASIVVNLIKPMFGISPAGWAGVGAILGSAIALLFSFVGFKFLVFKPKNDPSVISNLPS